MLAPGADSRQRASIEVIEIRRVTGCGSLRGFAKVRLGCVIVGASGETDTRASLAVIAHVARLGCGFESMPRLPLGVSACPAALGDGYVAEK